MGRFSHLETGRAGHAPEPAVEVGRDFPPSATDQADLDAPACLLAGDDALFRDDLRAALRWYSRAVDLDSTQLESWTRMIRVLFLKGAPAEAGAWIGRALTAYPDAPMFLALRAVEQARRGLIRQAMANSDAVLLLAGQEPQAHIARGEVLVLADNPNAGWCFDQVLQLVPGDDWRTPMIIGLILMERRQWAKAIGYLVKAAERRERDPAVWYQVGRCRAALGQKAQARRAWDMAQELCQADDPLLAKLKRTKAGSLWGLLRRLLQRG